LLTMCFPDISYASVSYFLAKGEQRRAILAKR
jgi:hypothetical protein